MHTGQETYLSNIWKLYLIKTARAAMFMMPIITLFFQERGLSMTEIMLLQSIFAIAVVMLEIPSGYLADILDRKSTIVLAIIFAILGDIVYGSAYGFWMMLIAELLLAISGAFLSGADSALLYDSLKVAGKEAEHKKCASYLFSLGRFSEAFGAIVGGFIAAWSMPATFYLSAFVIFLTLPAALTIKEPPRSKLLKESNHLKEIFKIIKLAIYTNKKIKWLIIYGSALSANTLVAVWMLQPYFKLLDIPIKYFGFLWAAFNLSGALFALFAHLFENTLGLKRSLIILALFPILAHFMLSQFASLWVLPFILLYTVTHALSTPILQDYINKELDSSVRATVLSVYSLFSRFAFIILSPLIGYIADIYSLQSAFLASAIIFGVLSLLSLPFLFNAHKSSR